MLHASRRCPPARATTTGRLSVLFCSAAALALAAGAAWPPHHAAAQVSLVTSSIPDHATLSQLPYSLTLTFDDRILGDPESWIDVRHENQHVDAQDAVLDGDTGTTLSVPLRSTMGDGLYVVSWRTAALGDGAVSSGTLSFSVGKPGAVRSSGRTAAVAHGVAISTASTFTFTGTGANAIGAGTVQMNGFGSLRQPSIAMAGVTPNQTFVVQICSLAGDCSDATDPNAMVLSSADGSVDTTVGIVFPGPVSRITLTNMADATEVYQALIGPQSDGDATAPAPPDTGAGGSPQPDTGGGASGGGAN